MSSPMEALDDATVPPQLQEMVDDQEIPEETEDDALIFDTSHDPTLSSLREISSLASWTVSSHKPTCGATALLSPTPHAFWQSDGPQPHHLTLHFFKLVKIVKLRLYLDFALDESYTPTKLDFWAGWSSGYGLVQFAEWSGAEPRGWQDIDLLGCGVGGKEEIRCMVLQVRVMENHQNGKDTHLRGLQVFSVDERVGGKEKMGMTKVEERARDKINGIATVEPEEVSDDDGEGMEQIGILDAGWIGEVELK
ncbi:uncharacterized protein KY384_006561 [Bacidia gigantensis]|uniref:uncharacterized protein n=1 Tax=Bacidia gigantensis TaxID=2732470 RepID=UPI001D0392D0|nr:uncharacterized protein KY384_006561 [Bacidia gigantensis]KAG8528872.1 hypothetical protein KY384_006561 [Bacidia gigantensis]